VRDDGTHHRDGDGARPGKPSVVFLLSPLDAPEALDAREALAGFALGAEPSFIGFRAVP